MVPLDFRGRYRRFFVFRKVLAGKFSVPRAEQLERIGVSWEMLKRRALPGKWTEDLFGEFESAADFGPVSEVL